MLSKSTITKILINSTLGIILILIWLQFVDLSQIVSTISKANLWPLLIAFVFMLLSSVVRAIRLKVFLHEVKKIHLKDLIFLNGVAQMLNFFIPIRAGEIAKGVYLNTHYNLPLGKSVVWVFLDRFVDFLVVLMLAGVLLLIIPTSLNITFKSDSSQASLIKIIAVIFLAALAVAYLAIFQSNFTKKIVNFLKTIFIVNNIKIYFERFSHFILESFSILNRHPKDLILLIFITIIAYIVDAAIWYFTFIALGQNQDFLKMYLGQLLSALTYLIPAAPGYIGSAQVSGLLILSGVFGIEPNLASAMIVLFHISYAVFVIVFGLISVFSLKIDLGLIFKKVLKRG